MSKLAKIALGIIKDFIKENPKSRPAISVPQGLPLSLYNDFFGRGSAFLEPFIGDNFTIYRRDDNTFNKDNPIEWYINTGDCLGCFSIANAKEITIAEDYIMVDDFKIHLNPRFQPKCLPLIHQRQVKESKHYLTSNDIIEACDLYVEDLHKVQTQWDLHNLVDKIRKSYNELLVCGKPSYDTYDIMVKTEPVQVLHKGFKSKEKAEKWLKDNPQEENCFLRMDVVTPETVQYSMKD